MTNTNLLEEKIAASGLMKKHIAEKLGLSPYGLSKKISGQNEFKTGEIQELCKLLNITSLREKETIFFAGKVD